MHTRKPHMQTRMYKRTRHITHLNTCARTDLRSCTQDNLEQVGDLLELAIRQQSVSKEVGRLIRAGTKGCETLDEYLDAMARVKGGLKYFTDYAPGNPEMQTLYELHEQAMATVQAR